MSASLTNAFTVSKWFFPLSPWIKVNTDVAVWLYVCAGVTRNNMGEVLLAFTNLVTSADPLVAEASTMCAGLSMASSRNLEFIVLESIVLSWCQL
ncbi:hypothetical protein PanWU01x14_219540 [Parasponia andersonii]|uniref:Uncharacterized protein n=1 Tax=Parasponia andersonii TaxID=3476 RepID=A0A2P5BQ95_PARAD|nr:hypothetical protein PanWU01x14_219540 [Parasponia andersonii]